MASFIGGLDLQDDRKKMQGCRAVIGTPGRILHLIKNNVLNMADIRVFVLDEADKLMASSFFNDVKQIWQRIDKTQRRCQVLAASATFANGLDTKVAQFMQNPIGVSPKREVPILLGVRQFAYAMPTVTIADATDQDDDDDPKPVSTMQQMFAKIKAVERIFAIVPFKQCIIFSNSQQRAESYANYLSANGWEADVITGSQEQLVRLAVFKRFRTFKCRILVATDLMARGVDSENVNLVVNLDVPTDSVTYLHRIGRCGRFGTQGLAVTLLASDCEQMAFKKLLGCLGGSNMSVQMFPHEENDDVVIEDIFSYENDSRKLYGIDVDVLKSVGNNDVELKPEDMTTLEPPSLSCSSESDEVTEEKTSSSLSSSTKPSSPECIVDNKPVAPPVDVKTEIVDRNLNLLRAAKWLIENKTDQNQTNSGSGGDDVLSDVFSHLGFEQKKMVVDKTTIDENQTNVGGDVLSDVFSHLGFEPKKIVDDKTTTNDSVAAEELVEADLVDGYSMVTNASSTSNVATSTIDNINDNWTIKTSDRLSCLSDLSNIGSSPQMPLSTTSSSIKMNKKSSDDDNMETSEAAVARNGGSESMMAIKNTKKVGSKKNGGGKNNVSSSNSSSDGSVSDDEADDEASVKGSYGHVKGVPGARPLLERRWNDMYQLQLHHIQSYINYTKQFNNMA